LAFEKRSTCTTASISRNEIPQQAKWWFYLLNKPPQIEEQPSQLLKGSNKTFSTAMPPKLATRKMLLPPQMLKANNHRM
jgi:hypothetical protein